MIIHYNLLFEKKKGSKTENKYAQNRLLKIVQK